MLATLHELRDELRAVATHIEHDYPDTANHLRHIGNDLSRHAAEDAESIGEDADDSFSAGDGGGDE